jgi:N-methylhydantoinase B/oxoprolinase/acetone carboxylase alpha subunit
MQTIESTHVLDLSISVDRLGILNAQISALETEADAIKKTLKESGLEQIIGSLFKAAIKTSTRTSLDTAAVRKLLKPKQLEACTKTSTSTSVTLYGL